MRLAAPGRRTLPATGGQCNLKIKMYPMLHSVPHAVYLHSGLTQARIPVRDNAERRMVLRFSNQEVVVALTFAGLVNMAMVIMASSAFHAGHSDVAEIETAYHTLTPLLGIGAAGVFLVSPHRLGSVELDGRNHGGADDRPGAQAAERDHKSKRGARATPHWHSGRQGAFRKTPCSRCPAAIRLSVRKCDNARRSRFSCNRFRGRPAG
jgi:hypothetical protein